MKRIPKPRGVFQGYNFMTPDIIGYYKLRKGYAELSEGTDFHGKPTFGVSVRPDPDKKSKCCFSRREADAYIEEMSDDD